MGKENSGVVSYPTLFFIDNSLIYYPCERKVYSYMIKTIAKIRRKEYSNPEYYVTGNMERVKNSKDQFYFTYQFLCGYVKETNRSKNALLKLQSESDSILTDCFVEAVREVNDLSTKFNDIRLKGKFHDNYRFPTYSKFIEVVKREAGMSNLNFGRYNAMIYR